MFLTHVKGNVAFLPLFFLKYLLVYLSTLSILILTIIKIWVFANEQGKWLSLKSPSCWL